VNERKPIPTFDSEAEERAFWEYENNDSADYIDRSHARSATLPSLRASKEPI